MKNENFEAAKFTKIKLFKESMYNTGEHVTSNF